MPRFKKVYIEITNRCNLHCSFCAVAERGARDMDEQEFMTVLTKIRPYTDYIYLHVLGEPLLHPKLLRFLDMAEAQDLQVNLTTNGLLLEETQDSLLKNGALRQINISLHSKGGYTRPAEQESYIRMAAGFAGRANEIYGKIVSFRLWNLGVDDEIEADFNRMATDVLSKHFPSANASASEKSDRRGIKVAEKVFLSFDDRFAWPVPDSAHEDHTGFCLGLRDQIAVLSDGTVVPCCLDTGGGISLGNLFVQEMEEVLGSPRAKALYQGFSSRKVIEPLCTGCTYKNRFQNR